MAIQFLYRYVLVSEKQEHLLPNGLCYMLFTDHRIISMRGVGKTKVRCFETNYCLIDRGRMMAEADSVVSVSGEKNKENGLFTSRRYSCIRKSTYTYVFTIF